MQVDSSCPLELTVHTGSAADQCLWSNGRRRLHPLIWAKAFVVADEHIHKGVPVNDKKQLLQKKDDSPQGGHVCSVWHFVFEGPPTVCFQQPKREGSKKEVYVAGNLFLFARLFNRHTCSLTQINHSFIHSLLHTHLFKRAITWYPVGNRTISKGNTDAMSQNGRHDDQYRLRSSSRSPTNTPTCKYPVRI